VRPHNESMAASLTPESPRAAVWRLRTRTLELPRRPLIMGIVNVTPDSFCDGGSFATTSAAINHALRLVEQGADILDIGGESTRPYSIPVELAEELRRVLPVIEALSAQVDVPLSVDTSKAEVARRAVAAGAQIINDVTGLDGDPEMADVAAHCQAGVCVMHMQGTPQTMQDNPQYDDVLEDVFAYLRRRRDELITHGIAPQRIALDPGIGFGKSHDHNLTLLANCRRFHELGCPLLVGPSRKGFISKVLGDKEADRTAGTIGVTLSLAAQGVQVVRVHDVSPVNQALLLYEASGGHLA
jgi:dihydropteroate synthase